jgi:hypothetical protein
LCGARHNSRAEDSRGEAQSEVEREKSDAKRFERLDKRGEDGVGERRGEKELRGCSICGGEGVDVWLWPDVSESCVRTTARR